MEAIQRIKSARKAGVPIVLVSTADQPAFIDRLRDGFTNGSTVPIVAWDCAAGLRAVNKAGEQILPPPPDDMGGFTPPPAGGALVDAVSIVSGAPVTTAILVLVNAHRALEEFPAVQAVQNVRERWKENKKTLVLLQPSTKLPNEIQNDVFLIDDPLPSRSEIGAIVTREHSNASNAFEDLAALDAEDREASVDALVGLPPFAIEQSLAVSIVERRAIVPSDLWERKRGQLSQIPGLSLDTAERTLNRMGGLVQIRQFADFLMRGDEPPALIVRIDEIEKAMAGAGSDLSGVSTDQLGVLLSAMEDNGWSGSILVGVPGSGKSEFSKCLGASYGRRTLTLDMGAAKGSLVGQSEQQIRNMVKTIVSIAGDRAFFLASCNKLENLPPELKRRFRFGLWFFDLPNVEEREAIWRVQLQAFKLPADIERPNDENWTGAEIRNACLLASRLKITPAQTTPYIIPVAQSDPESVERLRRAAAGKWLSASYPGAYQLKSREVASTPAARRYE